MKMLSLLVYLGVWIALVVSVVFYPTYDTYWYVVLLLFILGAVVYMDYPQKED